MDCGCLHQRTTVRCEFFQLARMPTTRSGDWFADVHMKIRVFECLRASGCVCLFVCMLVHDNMYFGARESVA